MKVLKNKSARIAIAAPIRYLVVAMAAAFPIMVSQADVSNTQIGDLEIYKPATAGKAIVTMMLDTSGSMGSSSIQVDGLSCSSPTVFTENFNFTDTNGNIIKSFTKADGTTATVGANGVLAASYMGCDVNNMSRLSRVKRAMFGLLANGQAISAKNEIGIGNFSYGGDGYRGMMAVPAKPLTPEQRLNLLNYLNALVANGGTPTAHAYAEAGAYLMGTNTSAGLVNETRYTEQGVSIPYSSNNYQLFQCLTTNFKPITFNGQTWYSCLYSSAGAAGTEGYYTAYPLGYNNYYVDNKTTASALNLGLIGSPNTTVSPTKLVSQTGNGKTYTNGTMYGTAKTQYWPTDTDPYTNSIMSGFGVSNNTTKTADTKNYQSPISSDPNAASCDGYGVYFLTDGEPNQNSRFDTQPMMGDSLNDTTFTCDGGLPIQGSQAGTDTTSTGITYSESGWDCIGAYSKRLNSNKNPIGKPLKTAAVGFGATFASMASSTRTIQVKDSNGNLVNKAIPDCSKGNEVDTQNLCKLTELKSDPASPVQSGGWGEGGFTATSNASDVANSLQNFLGSLNNSFPAAPSGTIVVPDDPYRADSQLAVAYYPTLLANVTGSSAIWGGNVKKYDLNEGTLFGYGASATNPQALFLSTGGLSLDPTTADMWSSSNVAGANNLVTAGGYVSQLPEPSTSSVNTTRTLWLEDFNTTTDTTPKLRKFSVNSSGKVMLDGAVLSTSNTFNDTKTYGSTTTALSTNIAQQGLLNFLGYSGFDTTKSLSAITLSGSAAPVRIAGASVHSAPVAVSYSATLDANGKVTNARDDYALFGSSDGALHLVDADDANNTNGGKELFAFIPKSMLGSQPTALVNGGTSTFGADHPYAGIDAPWLVTADYKYDFPNKQVTVDSSTGKGVFAYGGLRMGGSEMYGMDITNYNAPKLMFDITPSTTGFTRMGQIWSQPTRAKMKTSSTDTTGTNVLIFGGGYDTCYENQNFQVGVTATSGNAISSTCAAEKQAQGNAIYIVNAQTGALLWSASSDSSANTVVPTMTNSVVAGVTALDRNNDGIIDNIYFADLGGQVFRADFTNGIAAAGSARVTRILANANTGTNAQYAYRFYERPVVSFYRNASNNLFALVNVISGDRSSPLSPIRTASTFPDRLYGIMDTDVTLPDSIFYGTTFSSTIHDLTDSALTSIPTALATAAGGTMPSTGYTATQKATAISAEQASTNHGWYYPLTRFDGYENVPGGKGVGKSAVIGSYLYTTVYNPNMKYGTADPCIAQIMGGSERELYCLPYGICTDSTSLTGTGGYARAGQGIQELTLGPRSANQTNQRLLIGTQTLTQRLTNRENFNTDANKSLATAASAVGLTSTAVGGATQTGGDGSAAEFVFNERYVLTPNTWFEANR